MGFCDNGKFIGFCLFSCIVHVLVFALLNCSQYRNMASDRSSQSGISFVSATYYDFRPERKLSPDVAIAPVSAAAAKVQEPSLVSPLPVVNIKNQAIGENSIVKRQEARGKRAAEVEPADPLVISDLDAAVDQFSRKTAETGRQDVDEYQAALASPFVVQSPVFAAVDHLFGNDAQSGKQIGASVPVHDYNDASVLVKDGGEQNPEAGTMQALPLYDVNPKPDYPDVARSRGWQGRVLLEVTVSVDGTVDKVSLMKSSGYRVLDKAARKTVYRWKFVPAHVGGGSVPCKVQVPVDFHLNAVRG